MAADKKQYYEKPELKIPRRPASEGPDMITPEEKDEQVTSREEQLKPDRENSRDPFRDYEESVFSPGSKRFKGKTGDVSKLNNEINNGLDMGSSPVPIIPPQNRNPIGDSNPRDKRRAIAQIAVAAGWGIRTADEELREELGMENKFAFEFRKMVDEESSKWNEVKSEVIDKLKRHYEEVGYPEFSEKQKEIMVSENPDFEEFVLSGTSPVAEAFTNPIVGALSEKMQTILFDKTKDLATRKLAEHGIDLAAIGTQKAVIREGLSVASKEAATKLITKAGFKGAEKIAASAVGTPLLAAAMEVLDQVNDKLVKPVIQGFKNKAKDVATAIGIEIHNKKEAVAAVLGVGMVITGLIVGTPLLIAAGITVTSVAVMVGGTAAVAAGFSAATTVLFGAVVSSLFRGAISVLIFFFSLTMLTALILFIINSGAYVVPPGSGITNIDRGDLQSDYIGVTKSVSENNFENSDLPITVTYTVTITAKKGSLSNISVEDTCNVVSKSGGAQCDHSPDVEIPQVIDPGTPFTYSYDETYDGSEFVDSYVINTVTITADAEEAAGERASASASILIGDAPTGCFVFEETTGYLDDLGVTSLGWNNYPSKKATVIYSINYLMQSSEWHRRACSSGPIILVHAQTLSAHPEWAGWAPRGTNYLVLYSVEAFRYGKDSTLYTFAHEVGHHIDYRNGDVIDAYRDLAAAESALPTYPISTNDPAFEDRAETMAVYPIYKFYPSFQGILDLPSWAGHKAFGQYIYQIEF